MFFGKLIAGLIGLLAGGLPGLLVGLLLGHLFDRALSGLPGFGSPEQLQRIRDSFFETTFLLSGHIAKVDGRISEQEIAHTEQVFAQMGLTADRRRLAIELFHRGAAPDFDVEATVARFVSAGGRHVQVRQALLMFLISLAQADAHLAPVEKQALAHIAALLGVGAAQFEQLLQMLNAQGRFHDAGPGAGAAPPRGEGRALEDAYAAIGVASDVGDRELKRAYRKRMSENHPDRLIARGVPEEMVRLATERTQEIQAAYDLIRRHRGTGA